MKAWPAALASDSAKQLKVAKSLVDALADLHTVDPASVSLSSLGRPAGFVERQIAGWTRRWHAASTRAVPDMDVVSGLLESQIPQSQRVAILHNDYKLDNTMVDADGALVAVFDWDMATLGDPLVDVGTLLAYWAQPDDPTYLVFGSHAVAIGDVMSKDTVRERYARGSGLEIDRINFYESLALFRIAVIIEQIYARYLAGHTSDSRFAAFEPVAPLLAAAARERLA